MSDVELEFSPFLDQGESTLQYFKPKVMPIVWEFGPALHPSLVEGLRAFYHRTPFFELSSVEQIRGRDIDALLRQAVRRRHVDWACVIGEGTIFSSQNKVVEEIERLIEKRDEEVLVCGHLINKKGYYCGLHEQFMLVNLRVYEKLGCPDFGSHRQGRKMLRDYTAGDSIHDDYTPRWLKPLPTTSEHDTRACGWGLIHASLEAGLPVYNIDDELRSLKGYLYPTDEIEKVNKNLDLIYQLEDLKNHSQKVVLMHLLMKRFNLKPTRGGPFTYTERKNCLFFFNTEFLLPDDHWRPHFERPLDVYSGPCSGFQDVTFCRVAGIHEGTELVYFDMFDNAIELKKMVLDEFSGHLRELPELFERCRARFPDEEIYCGPIDFKVKEILHHFNRSEQEFFEFWQRFRKLKRVFAKVNLLSDYDRLVAMFPPEGTGILNLTDIYLGQNEIVRGMHKMRECLQSLQDACRSRPDLFLTGQSLNLNRFFGRANELNFDEI